LLTALFFGFFIFSTLIQLVYWLFVFLRFAVYKVEGAAPLSYPSVSVIVCAHNEEENLRKFLPRLLQQNYPDYEVIVVNDNSSDRSLDVLLDIRNIYPNLRVRNLNYAKSRQSGKKFALEKGVHFAKNNVLLLTDADCFPASEHWIASMVKALEEDTEVVLGYGPYCAKKGWLNKWIRFETVFTAVQYFSFALLGIPYMGVGRNLLYRKNLFLEQEGFNEHIDLASGDDDLFINAVATRENTRLALHPDAFTYSLPKETWKQYYRQKSRHVTTGLRYKWFHVILLGAYSGTHFVHYFAGILLLCFNVSPVSVVLLYALRLLTMWVILNQIFQKFQEPGLKGWVPAFDAMYISYYILFFPNLLLKNLNYWK
jgi:biofilm PGA synthesis N-glycosyltransferase PgaC